MNLRVAIEVGAALPRPTGVGTYIRDLATSLLSRYPDQIRLVGVRSDGPLATLLPDASAFDVRGRYLAWLQHAAEQQAAAVDASLVHYTNTLAPLWPKRPFVVTVQDVSLIRFPHYHPAVRVTTIPLIALAVHRARRVIVPSRATRDELMRTLRVDPGRIAVVPLAPSRHLVRSTAASNAQADDLIPQPARYVLSVATLEPRKNLSRLIAAFERLAEEDPELKLILIGASGWRTQKIEHALRRSRVAERIVTTGYLHDAQKATLMADCAAFAYVSLYEGYGLPVVEAMAAGAPVVTSNVSSMPEAAGGAAVLVDPRDPLDVARGLREAMNRREELVERGRQRVAHLSWDRVADETMAVYEDALKRW